MAAVVLTIHLLIAFALIIVVLLQRSEGGGLGIGGGGGAGIMTGRGAATALAKLTWLLGIAFVVTGFLAAFNRISWAWVALVVVGAFLVFAGPAIVANLRSSFS